MMTLNVHAPEFSPKWNWLGGYTECCDHGKPPRNNLPDNHDALMSGSLLNIPNEIICEIIERMEDPRDLLALSLTSKECRQAILDSRVHCSVDHLPMLGQQIFVQQLPSFLPGLVRLDLKGCDSVPSRCILSAVRDLSKLEHLDVTACRQLSNTDAKELCSFMCSHQSALTRLGDRGCALWSLAMQKCYRMATSTLSDVLEAAASADSRLTTLTMSHLNFFDWPSPMSPQSPPGSPVVHNIQSTTLRILALNNCVHLAADNLCYLAACCPDLEMLFLGGVSTAIVGPMEEGNGRDSSIISCKKQDQERHSRTGAVLAESLSVLPKLQAVELTHFHQDTKARVASAMPAVKVWDFNNVSDLRAACRLLEVAEGEKSKLATGYQLAFRAAIDCCCWSTRSPLHYAVRENDLEKVKLAVRLGGNIEKKDSAGATPLFLACEHNRPAIALFLTSKGAALTTTNRAEEAPLYIAALKGYCEVVHIMLKAFKDRQLPWMDQKLYGAGWNPLMAASVSGHPEAPAIVNALLISAGDRAVEMCFHRHRYGKTAAHIAASTGHDAVLATLLKATSLKLAAAKDLDGQTPLKDAQAGKHEECAKLLAKAVKEIQISAPAFGAQQGRRRTRRGRSRVGRGGRIL